METVSFTRQLSVAENVDVLGSRAPAPPVSAPLSVRPAMGPGLLCLIRTDV